PIHSYSRALSNSIARDCFGLASSTRTRGKTHSDREHATTANGAAEPCPGQGLTPYRGCSNLRSLGAVAKRLRQRIANPPSPVQIRAAPLAPLLLTSFVRR